MQKGGYVYIIGNSKPTLYIGVTSNLIRRIYEHRNNIHKGFSNTYGTHRLLYYERYEYITDAIAREKQLKNWHRDWKINLIKESNPLFKDLYAELLQ